MVDTDEEARMLMAKWDAEHSEHAYDSDDEEVADADLTDMDDVYEKYRRPVTLKDAAVDHVILGTGDLSRAMNDMEQLLGKGVRPIGVTSMNGLGLVSARLALTSPNSSEGCYLEILGPDPKQNMDTDLVNHLKTLPEGGIVPVHYGVRQSSTSENVKPNHSWTCDKVTMVDRDRGMPVMYDMRIWEGHELGGLVPNFISWPETAEEAGHPGGKLPIAGQLDQVVVQVANAADEDVIYKMTTGVDKIEIVSGEDNMLEFCFTTADNMPISFSGRNPVGFSFPKQGGLEVKKPDYDL